MTDSDSQPHQGELSGMESGAKAVDAIFRTEASRLVRYFQFRLRGSADPVDFVQEAFTRLISRSARGGVENPAAYLNRIARNLLFEHGRQQKVRVDHEVEMPPDFESPVAPDQEERIESDQMMEAYHKAVDELPPRTKEAFLLHRHGDLTYSEVAQKLGISPETVHWHIKEALLRVRRKLDQQ